VNSKMTIGQVIITTLAVIGALALFAAAGMFGMHLMMGGTFSGIGLHPMAGMCRGMMGS
jgi:hypothetical protein